MPQNSPAVDAAISSVPRPAPPAALQGAPDPDPALNPRAYPSAEAGGAPPHVVQFPNGSKVAFPGHLSQDELSAAASQVWQGLKQRASNVVTNVKAGVTPVVQDVVDVSAPAIARQMYRKYTGKPNTLDQVPGKAVKAMAPVLLGPEVLGEEGTAAAAEGEGAAAPDTAKVSDGVRSTRGQVVDVHRAELTNSKGNIVGHVDALQPVGGREWIINSSEISPELRGQGYGKQLYSQVLDAAKEQGAVVRAGGVQTPEAERVWRSLAKEYPEITKAPDGTFVADFRKAEYTPQQARQLAESGNTIELFRRPSRIVSSGIPESARSGNTMELMRKGAPKIVIDENGARVASEPVLPTTVSKDAASVLSGRK